MMAYHLGSSGFRYMKRQGFPTYGRTRKGRKICHFGRLKRAVKKVEKTFWFCFVIYSYLKASAFTAVTAVKRMQSSKLGM